jgi:voltage-gated sodium channel
MHGNTVSAAEHRFETAVTAVIVANSVVMLLALIDDSHRDLLENIDVACLWCFAGELAVRLWKARLRFFHNPWSCFDALIIVAALLPAAGGGIAVARLGRLARSGHLLKHVAHLRLWRLFRGRVIGPHAREVGLATTVAVLLTVASLVAPAAHADGQVVEGCT